MTKRIPFSSLTKYGGVKSNAAINDAPQPVEQDSQVQRKPETLAVSVRRSMGMFTVEEAAQVVSLAPLAIKRAVCLGLIDYNANTHGEVLIDSGQLRNLMADGVPPVPELDYDGEWFSGKIYFTRHDMQSHLQEHAAKASDSDMEQRIVLTSFTRRSQDYLITELRGRAKYHVKESGGDGQLIKRLYASPDAFNSIIDKAVAGVKKQTFDIGGKKRLPVTELTTEKAIREAVSQAF